MLRFSRLLVAFLIGFFFLSRPCYAQQLQGSMEGTVTDVSSAAVGGAYVSIRDTSTNFERTATTNDSGTYHTYGLPVGTYVVTFTKDGFRKEEHSQVVVQGNRTTTVNASLRPGDVNASVVVNATPLLNQVDTTNGYVLGTVEINFTPLGTGSFTQLAILSPGINADFLGGSGTNAGLGNQEIWANGQRDTSNSFTVNGIDANNLFNGKTSSQVAGNRFVLSTGENFVGGNNQSDIQTSTSVYNAIGQALPTPPQETIEEIRVNTSMYDASQGANSGAHVELTTKSGTNDFHGEAYEYHQTSGWNAAPFFRNNDPGLIAIGAQRPELHYNKFGGTLGGPIYKNKLFFFGAYQGLRTTDQLNATSFLNMPPGLTNDRTAQGLANEVNADFNNNPGCADATKTCFSPSQIDPVALKLLNFKLSNGQFLVPSAQGAIVNGHNAVLQSSDTFKADQVTGKIDYVFSDKDRLSGSYYFQNDPTSSPFAIADVAGFNQTMRAGSQVISLLNTTVLSPHLTWDQKAGFIRMRAFANTVQPLTPSDAGINIFGSTLFPGITINNVGANGALNLGPTSPFSNAGVFQNRFDWGSNLNWELGRHTLSFGFNWDYTQLNVINSHNQAAGLTFNSWEDFLTGTLKLGEEASAYFNGSSNRYYRAQQQGLYAQDKIRLTSTLNLTLGLRFDHDGALSEKSGLLTNFYTKNYSYSLATDTIKSIGLVVAGNNKQFGTKGVSDSTMIGRQWVLEPRIGLAWSPKFIKNFVVRAGFGLYADRGQFFTEFSPSAGFGFNGPFGVTLEPPFIVPVLATSSSTFASPFGAKAPPPPPTNLSSVAALLPNQAALSSCNANTAGYPFCGGATPFLFGGYDPNNTLPYTENWTLDLQWQLRNDWAFSLAYIGNHGLHETLPIPFNEPRIATPQRPVNGQIYSYGYIPTDANGNPLATESVNTSTGGNTDLRVPYIGYSPNSVFYEAEGISNYNGLQVGATKRLSKGLTITAAYTWSHTLDEGSGLGLFYNGNDPLTPRNGYGNADFDRTHVFSISYQYAFPKFTDKGRIQSILANDWALSGVTILQSGQPYSVIDFSGAAGSLFFSANDFLTNPIVQLNGTPKSAQNSGTLGVVVDPNNPVLNPNSFGVVTVAPGASGVPPCGPTAPINGPSTTLCDNVETGFSNTGRNVFRGPFQDRFDLALSKQLKITERLALKFRADAFNIFNHPSFDTPNNNVTFNPCFNPQPCYAGAGPAGNGSTPQGQLGQIQHTLGSPRFVQLSLRLLF